MTAIIPNSFQNPNLYVDQLLHLLLPEEYVVLSYLTRRIIGFHKRQDRISLSQLTNGLISKAGEHLDYGTGLSTNTNRKCVQSLKKYGIVIQVAENDPYQNEGACYALELDTDKIDFTGLQQRAEKRHETDTKRTARARKIGNEKREAIQSDSTTSCSTTPPSIGLDEGTDVGLHDGDDVELQHKRQSRKPVGKPEGEEQLTLPSTPPREEKKKINSKRDPNLDHPACQLYRKICHLTANEIQRKQIADEIEDLEHWKTTLTNWMLQGWKPTNVFGLLDSYRKSKTQVVPPLADKKEQSSVEMEIMFAALHPADRGEWLRLIRSENPDTRTKYMHQWRSGQRDLKHAA